MKFLGRGPQRIPCGGAECRRAAVGTKFFVEHTGKPGGGGENARKTAPSQTCPAWRTVVQRENA